MKRPSTEIETEADPLPHVGDAPAVQPNAGRIE